MITVQWYMKGWWPNEEGSRRLMTTYLAVQVQYGNTSDALMANRTHASMHFSLNVHSLQPEAVM